jgi:hypothetical protein
MWQVTQLSAAILIMEYVSFITKGCSMCRVRNVVKTLGASRFEMRGWLYEFVESYYVERRLSMLARG